MPLIIPDSLFGDIHTTDTSEEYVLEVPAGWAGDPINPIPAGALTDDELAFREGSLIKERKIVNCHFVKPHDDTLVPIFIDQQGCAVFRIQETCTSTTEIYYGHGANALLIYRMTGILTPGQFRLVRICPDRSVLDLGQAPSVTTPPTTPPPMIEGQPYVWIPPRVIQAGSAHGYSQRIEEGDNSVLVEAVWLQDGPARMSNCVVTVNYLLGFRTTRFRLSDSVQVGSSATIPSTALVRKEFTWKVPGCCPGKEN